MAKYLDPKRIEAILAGSRRDWGDESVHIVDGRDIENLARRISTELGSVPAVEPVYMVVSCDPDGTPRVQSSDEIMVASLDWFENMPDPVKALMGKMEADEVCVIKGQFHLFTGEWDTHQLIKRVL